MKDYAKSHPTFLGVAGGMAVVALVLLFVSMSQRSAAADALAQAENLRKSMKASEGAALSSGARRQLEAEVGVLRARVAELEKSLSVPKASGGADAVLAYGNKLRELSVALDTAAADHGILVPEKLGFPAEVSPDAVPTCLPLIELAQRLLEKAVKSGVRQISLVAPMKGAEDFFPADMQEAGTVKRSVVVFEVRGPVETLAKLLHSLQLKESLYVIPRARLWREKPDSPEATLKFAAGAVEVGEAKSDEKGGDGGGFIFGR
jgi:hypothetical protein